MTPQEIVACIDLTSLHSTDTPATLSALCQKAQNPLGSVAAVCCYPQFIPTVQACLPKTISIATVVNFPFATASISEVEVETCAALQAGASEIDLVIPYQQVLQGDLSSSIEMVEAVKQLCKDKLLKVIIETGALQNPDLIYRLSVELLQHGADFIKTSTGKIAVGASEEAVNAILKALAQHQRKTGDLKGLKVSGGIKTLAQAKFYMSLAEEYFGESYLQPQTFRIGASSLLDEVLSLHSH